MLIPVMVPYRGKKISLQIICIIVEYLISYNCVQKNLEETTHKKCKMNAIP